MKYRKQALDSLSVKSQYHETYNIVPPHAWLTLLLVFLIIIASLTIALYGTVKTQVQGKGIILSENGEIYNVVSPIDFSKVVAITAKPGVAVKKGDLLMSLENPELSKQIQVAQHYIKTLEIDYESLKNESISEMNEVDQLFARKEETINKTINVELESIQLLENLSKKFSMMLEKGLTTQIDHQKIYTDLNNSKHNLQQSHQMLTEILIEKKRQKQIWTERLREQANKIKAEQFRLQDLQEKKSLIKDITSPIDGLILGLQASVGEIYAAGNGLINLSTYDKGLDVISYFTPENGKKINVGMRALVSPTNIKPEEYGSLEGKVIEVSPFPMNKNVMMSILKNESLVEQFSQNSSPIMAKIRITRNKKNHSGYQWSSSHGPGEQITPGTTAEIKIIVKRQKPIELVAPFFKKIFGQE